MQVELVEFKRHRKLQVNLQVNTRTDSLTLLTFESQLWDILPLTTLVFTPAHMADYPRIRTHV